MATSIMTVHYPRELKLRGDRRVIVRLMNSGDRDKVLAFAQALPSDDLLFLRTDITDPAIVDAWIANIERGTTTTLLAEIDGELCAYASVHRDEARWTRRVGEIRMIVGAPWRGGGLGRRLAAEVFLLARSQGLRKITAMMTADQAGARAVFEKFGFQVEALLADWVEDRQGRPRDLVVMSHDVDGFSGQAPA